MKWATILYLAPAVSAIVNPNQQVFQDLAIETKDRSTGFLDNVKSGFDGYVVELQDKVSVAKSKAQSILDDAVHAFSVASKSMTGDVFDTNSWLEEDLDALYDAEELGMFDDESIMVEEEQFEEPPHHGPPEHGPPGHGHHPHPPHKRPHRDPHHPKHSHLTIYQLIAESKYTTKLAELLEDYPDIVKTLNSTKANHTIFVPIDAAFDKIPKDHPKPSKEQIESLLAYHVAPGLYPAFRVLTSHTIPTLLKSDELAEKPVAQSLTPRVGLRGLTINFYSRIVGANLFATNGIIHAVDSFIVPPPRVLTIIDLLPSEFSTLELALTKTGLVEDLDKPHKGGTFFAPSNFAFAKLGPRINAFLFSKYGQKYLKAVLKYHVVPEVTLYSDHVLGEKSDDKDNEEEATTRPGRSYKHYSLPTLLDKEPLAVDVIRYGSWISIRLNGFTRVVTQDGVAKDGVIQIVGNVLIPPKNKDGEKDSTVYDAEGYMCLDDFKSRFEAYLE